MCASSTFSRPQNWTKLQVNDEVQRFLAELRNRRISGKETLDQLHDAPTRARMSAVQPRWPLLKKVADAVRYTHRNNPESIEAKLLAGKLRLADKLAYGDPLTSGSRWQTRLDPDVLELLDFIPGPGTAAKATIGALGIRNLADPKILDLEDKLRWKLLRMDPKDWKAQAAEVRKTPGFYPIPRGRDLNPSKPIVEFGYELPAGELNPRPNWKPYGLDEDKFTTSLADFYNHPDLLRAYPDLEDMYVIYDPQLPYRGMIDGEGIHLGPKTTNTHKTLLHELGHFAQEYEGWPPGTNPDWALNKFKQLDPNFSPYMARQKDLVARLKSMPLPEITRQTAPTLTQQMYRRAAGEQLAEALGMSGVSGGGKIDEFYDVSPHQMYDPRKLHEEVRALRAKARELDFTK